MLLAKIETLIPYEKNPRKISQKAIDVVSKSIRMNGMRDPIEVDENMVILSGHTRLKAYKALGYTEVPYVQHTDMTEVQKRTYRIAANKTAEYSEWDDELLAAELKDIDYEIEQLQESTGMAKDYEFNIDEHWQNMPEFDQQGIKPYKEIIVRFLDEYSYNEFSDKINQKLTQNTKSIWYPKQDFDQCDRNRVIQ